MTATALPRPGQLGRPVLIAVGVAIAVWLRWATTVGGTDDALVVGFGFGLGLLGVALVGGWRPSLATARSLAMGIAGGVVLVVLALATRSGPSISLAPAAPFVPWALVTILVASTEEAVLRGALFTELDARLGVAAAVLLTSLAFAVLHVPLYGWRVVPLDIGVGLWLAGLRLASGGVAAPALAHTLADIATWWL
jgi:membrane protease YdiL (CAAX protease family)